MPCAAVCPVNAIQRVDGAVQLNESLCVSCKLCGIACPFGAIEFSGSRPLDIPANANTRLAPPRRRRRRQLAARLGAGRARHCREMRPLPLR
jgi:Fe-S-cluster-containing hydrogenase component 2